MGYVWVGVHTVEKSLMLDVRVYEAMNMRTNSDPCHKHQEDEGRKEDALVALVALVAALALALVDLMDTGVKG